MKIEQMNTDYPRIVRLFLEKLELLDKYERKMVVEFMKVASNPMIEVGKIDLADLKKGKALWRTK